IRNPPHQYRIRACMEHSLSGPQTVTASLDRSCDGAASVRRSFLTRITFSQAACAWAGARFTAFYSSFGTNEAWLACAVARLELIWFITPCIPDISSVINKPARLLETIEPCLMGLNSSLCSPATPPDV